MKTKPKQAKSTQIEHSLTAIGRREFYSISREHSLSLTFNWARTHTHTYARSHIAFVHISQIQNVSDSLNENNPNDEIVDVRM